MFLVEFSGYRILFFFFFETRVEEKKLYAREFDIVRNPTNLCTLTQKIGSVCIMGFIAVLAFDTGLNNACGDIRKGFLSFILLTWIYSK